MLEKRDAAIDLVWVQLLLKDRFDNIPHAQALQTKVKPAASLSLRSWHLRLVGRGAIRADGCAQVECEGVRKRRIEIPVHRFDGEAISVGLPRHAELTAGMCWPSQDRIPFMFLHGMADTLVPIRHARKLYAALPRGNKAFIQVRATDSRERAETVDVSVRGREAVHSCRDACLHVPESS